MWALHPSRETFMEVDSGVSWGQGAELTPCSAGHSCANYHLDRGNSATFLPSVYSESKEGSSYNGRYLCFSHVSMMLSAVPAFACDETMVRKPN